MDDWCSVEDLTRWAFAHSRVVMANEAHSGFTRCVRTREIGVRMIRAAHDAGVRRLAMEALPWPADGTPGPITALPAQAYGYLAQPDMRELITTALDLGWSLWAYEASIDPDADPGERPSLESTNRREREQAQNLCELLASAPADPLLVWCGNSHAMKTVSSEWVPMGHHFAAMSGTEQFVIDQTVTVDFSERGPQRWARELLASIADTLAANGGTAGILREHAPSPLNGWPGVDALVVSTENALT
jgi:hypothetical protein